MDSNRVQNSIRNIAFGVINRTVSIVFPFIVRTIFIKVLGEEYLGINSLFSSILQVLNLADLGFANAIVASMYKPIAENDTSKVSALMNLYKKIYKKIGCTILAIGIVITPFIDKLIKDNPPDSVNIYILWILYLCNTVVSYLFFAYKVSVINAHQRNDITERIGAICRVIISIFQIFTVVALKNIYLYVILTVICSVMYNLWCSYECNKLFPHYTCRGDLDSETKSIISRNIGALAVHKIGNTVSVSLDSIVISAFLGLSTVAIYGNYYYIISAVSIFINLIYGSITAGIGNSIASETREKNYSDFNILFFLNTWLLGWCSTCFICLFQDFMMVWMGKELLFELNVVLTLVLRFFFEQLRKIVLTYKDAAGMWWMDKWRPLAGCILNLVLNITLVRYIGVAGVAISTVISFVCVELPWEAHVLFKYYFVKSEVEYYKKMIRYIASIVVACIITFTVCEALPIYGGISAICIKAIICVIVPNIIFIVINNRKEEFICGKKLLMRSIMPYVKKIRKKILEEKYFKSVYIGEHDYLLDCFRILAVLMVLSVHVKGYLKDIPIIVERIFSIGAYGVALYFIISGYFSYSSIKKSRNNREYFIKKAIRILPMYYISLLLTFIIGTLVLKEYPIKPQWIYHIFFLNMFIPGKEWMWWNSVNFYWTMPAFIAWYILSPMIFKLLDNSQKMACGTLVISVATPFLKMRMYMFASTQFVNWNFFCLLYVFLFGALAYFVLLEKKRKIGVVYGIIIGCAGIIVGNRSGFFVFSLLFYFLIIITSMFSIKWDSKKINKIIKVFSKISYAIYLSHWFVLKLLSRTLNELPWEVGYILFISCSMVLGYVFNGFIEQFISKWIDGREKKL